MNTIEISTESIELLPDQQDSTLELAYANLTPEAFTLIQQHTNEIKGLMHRTAQDIIQIGQRLIEVKQCLGHGKFTNWLKLEFNWSISTATKFMHVAEQLKFVNFTNLHISSSALYIIAAPSTSKDARAEVIKRAVMGESISYTQAKEIVSKYKKKAKSQPDQLESTNVDANPKCNYHEPINGKEYETSAIPSVVNDLRGKDVNLKTSLPSLEYQFVAVGSEQQRIVQFQDKISNPQQKVNNRMNEFSNNDDLEVESLINEMATKLKNLTPEQLALVIKKSVEFGLTPCQLTLLSQVSQKALETLN
ncbi:hypothetical protein NIES22_66160 [Calothrix brevissima NIES-22]|nr:hypothetical protein NIES22_66160 [Calothrix brevissima NIES-22]